MTILSTLKFHVLSILLLGSMLSSVFAQVNKKGTSSDDCQLDDAKRWYQQGNLGKIENIMNCVDDPKSMSREKRIEAYQLITESYLYRDKIGAADNSFKKLLKLKPLYEADTLDPKVSYDLIYLSRSYSRRPIFSMNFGAGTNFSYIEMLENYGSDNTNGTNNHEGYLREIKLGFNFNLGFEIQLIKNFDLSIEASFAYRNFAFGDSLFISSNNDNPTNSTISSTISSEVVGDKANPFIYSILNFEENQFWIDVPLMLRYNITKWDGLHPYIYAGPAANFLLSANLSNIQRTTTAEVSGGGTATPKPENGNIILTSNDQQPSMRNMFNFSLVAGAGIKFRWLSNFVYFDLRYTRMFFNNVDINNRYANNELLYRYAHVDNDFRNDNFALTVGFIKAFYKPRKKREYNSVVIKRKYNRWLEKERNYIKKETDEDLKRELNSAIKDLERQKPSLLEDVQRGKTQGENYIKNQQKMMNDYKNKRPRVEVKYE